MSKQINYRDLIFALLFDIIHGEETSPYDVSDEEIEKVAWVAENVVRITLLSARETLGGGASVCEACDSRVEAKMTRFRGYMICPGCTNHLVLLDEVMRRGLKEPYQQKLDYYD